VFISVATLAELRYGIERMAEGRRRGRLEEWLRDELPLRFEGRVLPVTSAVADAWGKVVAHREARGRPISVMDAFIAATARMHGLTLVTRDASHFESSVSEIVNPWTGD
jgi:toxin FitB